LEIKLYNYFRSSASYRVRIALHYKGLEFEYTPIHLINQGGEQYSAEYKKVNPASEVPTLVHDGQNIGQSVAIIEYLDEVFPHPSLYPKEASKKAKVRQLCEIINCIQPLQNLKILKHFETDFQVREEQKQAWLNKWLPTAFEAYEETAKHTCGNFSVGDQVTAADLFLIPQVFTAQRYNINIDQFKLIQKINERCLQLPFFQKAHPYRQPDTPPDMRIP
jgi:maleylacetoacetate isomerase